MSTKVRFNPIPNDPAMTRTKKAAMSAAKKAAKAPKKTSLSALQKKARAWDALGKEVKRLIDNDKDITDIGEACAKAFGWMF